MGLKVGHSRTRERDTVGPRERDTVGHRERNTVGHRERNTAGPGVTLSMCSLCISCTELSSVYNFKMPPSSSSITVSCPLPQGVCHLHTDWSPAWIFS